MRSITPRRFARSVRRRGSIRLAMAYWGQALSLGPNLNAPMTPENGRRRTPRSRARSREPGVTPREQALIEALAARDTPPMAAAIAPRSIGRYAAAMQKAAERFPEDSDIQTLYADAQMNTMPWDYWQKDGSRRSRDGAVLDARTRDRATAGSCRRAALPHPPARGFGRSRSGQRERRSSRLADAGRGHMVHMPAHIYIRVGRYADAAEANVRAIAADEDYLAQCQAQGLYPVSYYPHNLHFLWAAATFEGAAGSGVDAARRWPRRCRITTPGALAWTADFPVTPMLAYARFGLWQEVLTEPSRRQRAVRDRHLALRARSRVRRARSSGRADAELAALEAVMKHEAFATTLKDLPLLTNLQIASRMLEGELGTKRGNADAAIASLREAVTIEDGPSLHRAAGVASPAAAGARRDAARGRSTGGGRSGLSRRTSSASARTGGRCSAWRRASRRREVERGGRCAAAIRKGVGASGHSAASSRISDAGATEAPRPSSAARDPRPSRGTVSSENR